MLRRKFQEPQDEKTNFSQRLEQRANRIAKKINRSNGNRDMSPLSVLEQEIAMTMENIVRLRHVKDSQLDSLLQMEIYTDTELMQMEARTPKYSAYRFPEREKLQRRLLHIEEERRRMALSHEEKEQAMHERLLSLLNKHFQLK